MIGKRAKEVLKIEGEAILSLIPKIDDQFKKAIDILYNCKGRIVLTGMGKVGFVARKISATLASTGTPSLYLHPAEAMHGDLGMVIKDDVVIIISNSGETEEILRILAPIKKINAKIISLTGNKNSTLAKNSDVVLEIKVEKEADPFDLAPTASTTASLAMGDALALELLEKKGFTKDKYAIYHPGGTIGKKLLKVKEIMRKDEFNPVVYEESLVKDVLFAITKAKTGAASIVDKNRILIGIFTDGDLRRHLEKGLNIFTEKIKNVMTKNPITIFKEKSIMEALKILQEDKIDELPVVDENNKPIGIIDIQDIIKI